MEMPSPQLKAALEKLLAFQPNPLANVKADELTHAGRPDYDAVEVQGDYFELLKRARKFVSCLREAPRGWELLKSHVAAVLAAVEEGSSFMHVLQAGWLLLRKQHPELEGVTSQQIVLYSCFHPVETVASQVVTIGQSICNDNPNEKAVFLRLQEETRKLSQVKAKHNYIGNSLLSQCEWSVSSVETLQRLQGMLGFPDITSCADAIKAAAKELTDSLEQARDIDHSTSPSPAAKSPVTDAAPSPLPARQLPATDCSHGPDFRSVCWFGTDYSFTDSQAACIRILWKCWENGTPEVSQATVLEQADLYSKRLVDLFKKHEAWGSMIVSGKKGAYRLKPTENSASKVRKSRG
jgi:hypothetical protein